MSIRSLFTCLLILGSVRCAFAGDVRLISDSMDLVCSVEVSWGADAPNEATTEFHTDVKKGWSITKPDKLCYRRPATPDNCDSGMTQWRTQWKCAESTDSGTQELSLK